MPKIKLIILFLLIPVLVSAKPATIQKQGPSQKELEIKAQQEKLECLQAQSKLLSAVQQETLLCNGNLHNYRSCVARVKDKQSSNTGKGALIGIGAAFLTGGVSLLVAGAAGAFVGHETADTVTEECGLEPSCSEEKILQSVKTKTGLTQIRCQP